MSAGATQLLAQATPLLAAESEDRAGTGARLAAFLARQAAEELIDARCADLVGAPVARATMRSRLAILTALDPTDRGATLNHLWHQLSGYCHQHSYELAPTPAEVRDCCERLTDLAVSSDTGNR